MRGFLALEPDAPTRETLRERQNRLRDALTRQGVSFPERLHVPLLTWPFATLEELEEAKGLMELSGLQQTLRPLAGLPNDDRPAEIGHTLEGVGGLQAELAVVLRETLDPDPPKVPLVRLARVSPPSRKVGAALRGSGLLGSGDGPFVAEALAIWRQTPQGFEIYYTMPFGHGGS